MAFDNEFIGRETVLREMLGCWKTTQIYGIFGTRSIGKSRLAEQFLIEVREQLKLCPKKHVVDLRDCLEIMATVMPLLPDYDENFKDYNASQVAAHFVTSIPDSELVAIIFDNTEDLLDNGLEVDFLKILSILSQSSNIKIIITSTTELELSCIQNCREIRLSALVEKEGLDLMTSAAPHIDFGHHAVDIVNRCEGLPLALLMVASVLEQNSILTPEDLVRLLDQCRIDTLSSDMYPSTDRIATVYMTFIRRLTDKVQKALSDLSFIPGSFNLQHAAGMLGMESNEDALHKLVEQMTKRHMVTKSQSDGYYGAPKRFDIHGIIRECLEEFVNDRRDLTDVRKKFCLMFGRQLIDLHERLSSSKFTQVIADLNLERPNFQKLYADVEFATPDTYPLFIQIARTDTENTIHIFLGSKGMHERFYGKCLELTKQYQRDVDRACIHISYGSALTNVMGNSQRGEQEYRKALKILIDMNRRDILLAEVLQRLGWNLGEQDRLEEGLSILKQAFEIENELGMHYERLILQTLSSTAVLSANIGDFEEALKFHSESLKRRKIVYGTENHSFIGSVMNNIGLVYLKMGDIEKAFRYFKRGLEIKESTKGPEKAILISRKNVADCLTRMGRHAEALEVVNKALETLGKVPDLYNEVRAKVYDVSASIYKGMEDYDSALSMLEKALRVRSDLLPYNIYNVQNMCECANLHVQIGNYDRAEKYVGNVLKVRQKFRKEHPNELLIVRCVITAIQLEGAKGGNLQKLEYFNEIGLEEANRLNLVSQASTYNQTELKLVRNDCQKAYSTVKTRLSQKNPNVNKYIYHK
ncbi:hypothetical protein FSP39_018596 [Pinctada imbricata]|uniref:Uncharacterized protein n=1 Tax=Pinctada imbricata TaxID=66713 RepID=A0AA89BXS4_PINIB|nr:hypothetical protein FSP39_018596 [Pinctada imbricata]